MSIRGRCTLAKTCKVNKKLESYQKQAIEGTISKLIPNYRSFTTQRELATALEKTWVPRKKAFRLVGRLILFFVYDVLLLISLPTTKKRGKFVDEDIND